MSSAVQLEPAMKYFPLEKPRPAQVTALEFIEDAVCRGYRNIVIAAPTGIGKSGVGAATGLWGASFDMAGFKPGGYYLVTQKMLQDQLEHDFPRWMTGYVSKGASLKSSSEYPCARFGNCMAGGMASGDPKNGKKCAQRSDKTCPYVHARWRFDMSDMAVTNYPYLFTEHMYVGELEPRNILIADECHTLEKQIIGFIEILVNKETLDAWAPGCRPVPKMDRSEDLVQWLREHYLRMCVERLNMLTENIVSSGYSNRRMQDEFNKLKTHVGRISYAVEDLAKNPDDWVFWQEETSDEYERNCTAKPLSAAPFMPLLIEEMGAIRVFMSAYPGPKDVFCRSLGLRPKEVAWLELDSTFPVDNRLIHMTTVGSMSRTYLEQTMPKMLEMCQTILEAHPNEKGIIHCFDQKTRLLTQRGLVSVLNLAASDKIMTLNPKTHQIEWQRSLFTLTKCASKLIKVSNRSIDFCVTPEHLIYAIPGRNGHKRAILEAGKLIGGYRVFGRKKAHYFKVPRTGHWKGKVFKLGPLRGSEGAAFLGWFLAEGSAYETIWKGKRRRCVAIAQTAIAKTPIPALCRRLGFHPYINPKQPNQLIIQNNALWIALRQGCYDGKGFGCFHKSAPNAIKAATKNCIQECIESMVNGDGSRNSNNGRRAGQAHPYYCTTSKKLCEDTVELALKSGYSACFRHVDRARWKPSKINGRRANSGKIYVIEIGVGATHARFHSSELQQVSCHELVACPVTKNGIVFAERNGKTYWSGNCHSYALGKRIYDFFRAGPLASRVLYSSKAAERAAHFNLHRMSPSPTVMLSPSIAEGFSFDDDLARFQIIAKVPYPYLGDRQVKAKMEIDREWYTLQTVMTVLQACGRIVRSDEDHGSTYILDHDFIRLYTDNTKFFPKWFRDAFKFY